MTVYNDSGLYKNITPKGVTSTGYVTVAPLATPTLVSFVATVDSNPAHIPAGTYYYRVSAINANGETLAAVEASATLADFGTITVKWVYLQGATGYKIYGRATGAEQLLYTVVDPTTTAWVDDYSLSPSGALPTVNTTASFTLDGAKQVRRTAAPTTGTWNTGDIVWNTNPSATGDVGWVCTSGGSPGTWAVFGSVGETDFQVIKVPFTWAGTAKNVDSTMSMITGAIVVRTIVVITTKYSGATSPTISVLAHAAGGDTTLQPTTDNIPTAENQYETSDLVDITGDSIIRVALGGTGGTGVGYAIVEYANPKA